MVPCSRFSRYRVSGTPLIQAVKVMTLDQDFRFTCAEGSLYTDAVVTPQGSGAEPRLVEDLRLLLGDSGFLALVLLPFDRSLGSIVLAQPDRFGDSSPSVSVQ